MGDGVPCYGALEIVGLLLFIIINYDCIVCIFVFDFVLFFVFFLSVYDCTLNIYILILILIDSILLLGLHVRLLRVIRNKIYYHCYLSGVFADRRL